MSATDELRSMLEERGVDYKAVDTESMRFTDWYTQGGAFCYTAVESESRYRDNMLHVETSCIARASMVASPKQAIDATIGEPQVENDEVKEALENILRITANNLYRQIRDSEAEHLEQVTTILKLETKNAKLRELCSALYKFAYDEYPDSAELNFADRMRELGLEV